MPQAFAEREMRDSAMDKIAVKASIADDFQAAEAIKALRTNILLCGDDVRAIGLTSYGAAEGKTSISFQLAASLAQNKKSVLLIDADLRQASLQERLAIRDKIDGLSQYLTGRAEMEDAVKQTDVPGLFVMFAGSVVSDPSELLGGERFKRLIASLKEAVDYIIVDTAALGQVIDCAAAAPALDGVLLVVDASHSSCKLERRIKGQLERTGCRILGVVLNRVDIKRRGRAHGNGVRTHLVDRGPMRR